MRKKVAALRVNLLAQGLECFEYWVIHSFHLPVYLIDTFPTRQGHIFATWWKCKVLEAQSERVAHTLAETDSVWDRL